MKDSRGKIIARVGGLIVRRTPSGLFHFEYRDATLLEIALFPLVYFVIGFLFVGAAYFVSLGRVVTYLTIFGGPFAGLVALFVVGLWGGLTGALWAFSAYREFRRGNRQRTDHKLQKRLQQLLAEDSPWVRAHLSAECDAQHANSTMPIQSFKEAISGIPQPLDSRWNYVVWEDSSPYPRLRDCWRQAPQRIRMK